MNIAKSVAAVTVALLAAPISATGQPEDRELAGCYKPLSGFATSVCTDAESCDTQTGVYKIVLKNSKATYGRRVVVMSGTFDGRIVDMPNHCAGANAQHVLTDRDGVSTISTSLDVACPVGGDFVNNIEVVETLEVSGGTGAYVQLIPGGTVTLTGKLGLKNGINKFKVTPLPGDELCFYGRD